MRATLAFFVIASLFLAGGYAEGLRHSLASQYTEAADESDYAIARFMQANCKDREEAVLYIPRIKKILRVGKNATVGSVEYETAVIDKLVRSESRIVEAHCHIMDLDAISRGFSEKDDLDEVLRRVGTDGIRERFWMEIPSAGDMSNVLDIEAKIIAQHRNASVEHRLVVVEPGLPPHVINYGFMPAVEEGMRKSHEMGAMIEYGGEYFHPLYLLDVDRCKPFAFKPSCVSRSSGDAAEVINRGELFFIHDRGYLDVR